MTSQDWRIEGDECVLLWRDVCVRLRERNAGGRYRPAQVDLPELAPFALWEWTEYRLVADRESVDRIGVSIGERRIRRDPDGSFWSIKYENQIGKSRIQVYLDGQPVAPLAVEVLSPKRPTPQAHLDFYRILLGDLTSRCLRLPFTFDAPTGHCADEAVEPPSPLFVYHFLRQNAADLSSALATVLREPHRLLTEREQVVPLSRATDVDPTIVAWVLGNPQEWVKAPHVAIADRLRGFAPDRIAQREAEETFDTAPNRFVRHFVQDMADWLSHPALARHAEALADARALIDRTLRDPLFDDVGRMSRFPTESQVLLRRDGYRELAQLWRQFNLARRPFFGPLQQAIDSRDIATLYEYWCFFELAERMGRVLGAEPCFRIRVSDERGLEPSATRCEFPGRDWRLSYNRTFKQPNTYSVQLCPDFTLERQGMRKVIFDAKFRFDLAHFTLAGDEAGTDEAEPADRVVKKVDLYKMHTYRDALSAQSAVVLFPGDESQFYSASERRTALVSLEDLLVTDSVMGVGAIAMSPDAGGRLAAGLETT